jgi:ankyrin repeat protein
MMVEVNKSIPFTQDVSEVATEKKLQELNSNPNLNEKNVVEIMNKFIPSYNANAIDSIQSSYTLLHIAAKFDCHIIANFLIKAGADVDSRDSDGCTPLHYTAIYGSNIAVAKILIANGANINQEDHFKRQPLYYALQDNHLRPTNFPIAKFLLNNGADRSDLHAYITETSKRKCIAIACVTSATAAAITPLILTYNTNFSVFAVMEGALVSVVSVGVIAYELAYTWTQRTINSKLDAVKLDDVKLDRVKLYDAPSCSRQPT